MGGWLMHGGNRLQDMDFAPPNPSRDANHIFAFTWDTVNSLTRDKCTLVSETAKDSFIWIRQNADFRRRNPILSGGHRICPGQQDYDWCSSRKCHHTAGTSIEWAETSNRSQKRRAQKAEMREGNWACLLILLLLLCLEAVLGVEQLMESSFSRDAFPPDFIFGAGTSAYQVKLPWEMLFGNHFIDGHVLKMCSIKCYVCHRFILFRWLKEIQSIERDRGRNVTIALFYVVVYV